MQEHQDYSLAIINRQHEHYLKLLDLYETRQTWAFNFAILLYSGGFSAVGVLLDKMYIRSVPPASLVAIGLLVLSFGLPLLMLPLCFLYVDVSVFCAALTEGNTEYFNHQYQALLFSLPSYTAPGEIAFKWLCDRKPKPLDIEWVANARVMLFYIAPAVGIACCIWAIVWEWYFERMRSVWVIGTAITCVVASLIALVPTIVACRKTQVARSHSHRRRVSEKPDQTPIRSTSSL